MSICSDVYISRKEARERVKSVLLYRQNELIELAIKSMRDSELTSILNENNDLYYYNIDTSLDKKSKSKYD